MYTDYIEDKEENYYADDDNNNKFDNEKLKRIVFFVLIFVILIILIVILAKGCSKTDSKGKVSINEKIPTVVVGKHSISLDVGESEKLYSDIINSSSPNAAVAWYSEDASVASVDEGNITAEGEGQTNIVALYRENGNVYQDKCLVTVTSNVVYPESIDLGQEEMTVKLGETVLLQVSITPVEAKISDLVFESEAPDIVSVDENGYITAESVGTTAIIVKSKDETVASSILVTVTETGTTEVNPTSLVLYGLSNGLTVGNTAEVAYNLLPSTATNVLLTWTSSDPSIATVENGIVTAHKAGSCTIVATTENGLSDKVDIIVESDNIPVSSINIDDTEITLPLGGTKLLSYSILPDNATNKNVTYTTSNSSVVFIDSNGIIAAIGVGTSTVTITTEDGQKSASINVTVTNSNESVTPAPEDPSSTDPSSGDPSSSDPSSGDPSSSDPSSTDPSSSDSCGVNSFTVKSNQSSAVTSNLKFENAKPFTNSNPGLTITHYDSCLKNVSYSLWYAESAESLNTSKSASNTGTITKNQDTFYFSSKNGNKNGYYYIKLTVKTNDGKSYYKYYYAIVGNNGKNSGIIIQNTTGDGNTFKITTTESDIKYIAYCLTTGTSCVPKMNGTNSKTIYYGYKTINSNSSVSIKTIYNKNQATYYSSTYSGNYICFQGANSSKTLLGQKQCRKINASKDKTSPVFSGSPKTKKSTLNGRSTVEVTFKVTETNKLTLKVCNIMQSTSVNGTCTPTTNVSVTKSSGIYTGTYKVYTDKVKSGQKITVCALATDDSGNKANKCYVVFTK